MKYRRYIRKGKPTKEYTAFFGAIKRCRNLRNPKYPQYGGRGIEVEYEDFDAFMDDLGHAPSPQHTLERVDTNDNYRPGNCRWALQVDQQNNRRNNRLFTWKGETHTMAEWSKIMGLNYQTVSSRVNNYGWDIERALTTKPDKTITQFKKKI